MRNDQLFVYNEADITHASAWSAIYKVDSSSLLDLSIRKARKESSGTCGGDI